MRFFNFLKRLLKGKNETDNEVLLLKNEVGKLKGEISTLKNLVSVLTNQEQAVKVPYWLENDTAKLPIRKKEGDAGYDAFANETVVVEPHKSGQISCGLGMAIPEGFAAHNVNRSGNSLGKAYGESIWVSDAFIDSNYRGICNFLVVNLGDTPVTIQQGDRVASLSLVKTYKFDFEEIHEYCKRTGKDYNEMMTTERGATGFGNSGR